MASVVGIGAAVFDILMTVDAFPREDTKLRGLETKFQCGGPCATGLVAISKLGESASYMGTVGDDMYGTFVKAEMERYGVDTSCVKESRPDLPQCRSAERQQQQPHLRMEPGRSGGAYGGGRRSGRSETGKVSASGRQPAGLRHFRGKKGP